MKKLIIVISIIMVTTASVVLISSMNPDSDVVSTSEQQDKPKKEMNSCCASDMNKTSEEGFTANSIYQVNSDWKNQFGNDVNIGTLKGNVQVFTMIFANCTYACPLLVNDMRKIEKSLTKEELSNVRFTLVSIDPERDTPERLNKFALDQKLNLSGWQLLTGSRNDIDDIAALLGFRYKKENDGSFSHSNIITILNSEGEIIHQHVGLNQDLNKTVKIIQDLNKRGV